MKKINDKEMMNVDGGGFGWIAASILAGVTFIIGIFSGYTNPNKGNN